MGWICDTKTIAVLQSLEHAYALKSTDWWRSTKALNMMVDPGHAGSGLTQAKFCSLVVTVTSQWSWPVRSRLMNLGGFPDCEGRCGSESMTYTSAASCQGAMARWLEGGRCGTL